MKITMTFFKPRGKFYMEEDFEIPDDIDDWDISKELKKIERFRKLIGTDVELGFTAIGFFKNKIPFMVSPYNF